MLLQQKDAPILCLRSAFYYFCARSRISESFEDLKNRLVFVHRNDEFQRTMQWFMPKYCGEKKNGARTMHTNWYIMKLAGFRRFKWRQKMLGAACSFWSVMNLSNRVTCGGLRLCSGFAVMRFGIAEKNWDCRPSPAGPAMWLEWD